VRGISAVDVIDILIIALIIFRPRKPPDRDSARGEGSPDFSASFDGIAGDVARRTEQQNS